MSCTRTDSVALIQEIAAPFVLENLGCIGDEARLVDCPVADSGDYSALAQDYDYDRSVLGYFRDYGNAGTCDPFAAEGGTFARIACGTSSSAGAPMPCMHVDTMHTEYLQL